MGVPSLVQVQDDGVDAALVVVVSIHPIAVTRKVLSLLQGKRRSCDFVDFAMAIQHASTTGHFGPLIIEPFLEQGLPCTIIEAIRP